MKICEYLGTMMKKVSENHTFDLGATNSVQYHATSVILT